jgi:hypothetical protein
MDFLASGRDKSYEDDFRARDEQMSSRNGPEAALADAQAQFLLRHQNGPHYEYVVEHP